VAEVLGKVAVDMPADGHLPLVGLYDEPILRPCDGAGEEGDEK
jgi:hypothetical protein